MDSPRLRDLLSWPLARDFLAIVGFVDREFSSVLVPSRGSSGPLTDEYVVEGLEYVVDGLVLDS